MPSQYPNKTQHNSIITRPTWKSCPGESHSSVNPVAVSLHASMLMCTHGTHARIPSAFQYVHTSTIIEALSRPICAHALTHVGAGNNSTSISHYMCTRGKGQWPHSAFFFEVLFPRCIVIRLKCFLHRQHPCMTWSHVNDMSNPVISVKNKYMYICIRT